MLRWEAAWGRSPGTRISLQQAWGLAEAWYGDDRRALEFHRKSPSETRAILAGLGLTSDFWRV